MVLEIGILVLRRGCLDPRIIFGITSPEVLFKEFTSLSSLPEDCCAYLFVHRIVSCLHRLKCYMLSRTTGVLHCTTFSKKLASAALVLIRQHLNF